MPHCDRAERIQPDAGEVHNAKGCSLPIMVFAITRARAPSSSSLGARCRTTRRLYLGISAAWTAGRGAGRMPSGIFNGATELDPRNAVILDEAGWTSHRAASLSSEAFPLTERAFALGSLNVFVRAIL